MHLQPVALNTELLQPPQQELGIAVWLKKKRKTDQFFKVLTLVDPRSYYLTALGSNIFLLIHLAAFRSLCLKESSCDTMTVLREKVGLHILRSWFQNPNMAAPINQVQLGLRPNNRRWWGHLVHDVIYGIFRLGLWLNVVPLYTVFPDYKT